MVASSSIVVFFIVVGLLNSGGCFLGFPEQDAAKPGPGVQSTAAQRNGQPSVEEEIEIYHRGMEAVRELQALGLFNFPAKPSSSDVEKSTGEADGVRRRLCGRQLAQAVRELCPKGCDPGRAPLSHAEPCTYGISDSQIVNQCCPQNSLPFLF